MVGRTLEAGPILTEAQVVDASSRGLGLPTSMAWPDEVVLVSEQLAGRGHRHGEKILGGEDVTLVPSARPRRSVRPVDLSERTGAGLINVIDW